MSWDAILFDFDDTLADTRPWKDLRDRAHRERDDHLWNEYFSRLPRAAPMVASADQESIAEALIALSEAGMPIAIVTRSPAKAVRTWFSERYGGWVPSVIVGFGDVSSTRDPVSDRVRGLRAALRHLAVRPSANVLNVGDAPLDVKAAHDAGMLSATFYSRVPTASLADVSLRAVRGLTEAPGSRHPRPGTGPMPAAAALVTSGVEGMEGTAGMAGALHVGGRYVKEGGGLHSAIATAKTGTWSDLLQLAACRLVEHAAAQCSNAPLILTTIPPRTDAPDRFAQLRSEVSNRLGLTESSDVLSWTRDIPGLRKVRTRDERQEMMREAFRARDVRGCTVILLDDVRTTGTTLNEAARAIERAGGAAISVALAQTWSPNWNRTADYQFPMAGSPWYGATDAERQRESKIASTRSNPDDPRPVMQQRQRGHRPKVQRRQQPRRTTAKRRQQTVDAIAMRRQREARCSCGHPRTQHTEHCRVPRCTCIAFVDPEP